jgi:hypothetical protein
MFVNRVPRILGPKSVEERRDWRKLHKEELHICTLHQVLGLIVQVE